MDPKEKAYVFRDYKPDFRSCCQIGYFPKVSSSFEKVIFPKKKLAAKAMTSQVLLD